MPRRNDNPHPSRQSAYERMLLADIENGIDPYAPSTVTEGQPQPRRDRTIPAAPLGWTPAPDED